MLTVFRLEKGLICLQECPCQPERLENSKYMANERVTCVVLLECGLSLELVPGVDKKDLLEKGVLRLCLKRLQNFSNEGTRTSLGVQRSWKSSGYASVLPMPEVSFQCLVIESISCIQCSTGKIK